MAYFTNFFSNYSFFLRRKFQVFGLLLLFLLPGTLFADSKNVQQTSQEQPIKMIPMKLTQSENYWIQTDGLWTNPSGLILIPRTTYLDLWSRLELTTNTLELEVDKNSELKDQLEVIQVEPPAEKHLGPFKVGCISFSVGLAVGVIATGVFLIGR